MLKKILKKSYLAIGAVIFVWVIKDVNFAEFSKIIPHINIYYYATAFVLYLPMIFIKSFRWKKILDVMNIKYSIKDSFYIYCSSLLLGLVTPGRIGDASKIIYLKKDNQSFSQAVFGVLFDKLSDLAFAGIFLAAVFPLLPLIPHLPFNYLEFLKFSLIILSAAILVFAFLYFKKESKLRALALKTLSEFKKFKLTDALYILLLTAVPWFIYFVMNYFIAASIGISAQIGFFYLAFSTAMIILTSLLPISILGIGTREAALLFLLTPLGLNKEIIILFSLLITFNYLSLFIICLYAWFKKPML